MTNYFSTRAYSIIESNESKELEFDVDLKGISAINDGDSDLKITIHLKEEHTRSKDPDEISFTVKPDESFEEVFYTSFSKVDITASSDYRIILRI